MEFDEDDYNDNRRIPSISPSIISNHSLPMFSASEVSIESSSITEPEMELHDNEYFVNEEVSSISSSVVTSSSLPMSSPPRGVNKNGADYNNEGRTSGISSSELSVLSLSSSLSLLQPIIEDENNEFNIAQEWFDTPIYENAALTGGDALYRILKLYVDNRLTKKALSDILETIDSLLPDDHILPKTKHMMLKLIDQLLPHSNNNVITKHRICSQCCKYLGKWSEEPPVLRCSRCNSKDVKGFFFEYSLESVLKDAFEMRQLYSLMDEYGLECAERDQEKLYDITSGSEYKKLKEIAIPGNYDLIMTWSTDGAQTAKSSTGSYLWPVYAQIANVAPKHRRSFQFVCGLYYCNRVHLKPDMNSYLFPFATGLQNLYTNGVEWYHPELNRTVVSKVVAPLAILDAPARCSVQNIMQYNGKYGCSSCEHPGETSEIGSGQNRVFPVLEKDPPLRTDKRMKLQEEIVNKYEDQMSNFRGVKGESVVSKIPFFDRAKGFVPDYMHGVLLGVMSMLLFIWCSSSNYKEDYYLNPDVRKDIDKDLKATAPPDDVTRTPGLLSELSNWKVSQFRAFLLHFGPVVLKDRLDFRYYEHFLLLAKAIYILSKNEISHEELDLAETLLYIFVIDVQKHYGRNRCSFNVHQLLHLTHYVRMWGPLWVWSAFSSEDGNGELLRSAHGSNKLDVELLNTIKIIHAYETIKFLIGIEKSVNQNRPQLLGPPTSYTLTNDDIRTLRSVTSLNNEQIQFGIRVYSRCKINKEIFTSNLYKRQKVRLNSCVSWKERTMFGIIKLFVKIDATVFCILHQLVESHEQKRQIQQKELKLKFSSIIKPVRKTYCTCAIPVEKIESKVILVCGYVCHLPNDVERK